MDSPTIALSVSPGPAKGKGSSDKTAEDDADAFSMSLDAAREEADGETETTTITIQGTTTGSDETDGETETTTITIHGTTTGSDETGAGTAQSEEDFTIEIETVVFSGDDLASNLTASTVVGGASLAATANGSFGVSGSISGSNEVRLEVGETLTFELPPTEGEVIGGQVTITNLFSNGETAEGALVFAYDAADNQLATYGALGNETGIVTIDIEMPFARLDIKAMDNQSWVLAKNSNFGVGSISAMIASVVDDLSESASQSINEVLKKSGSLLSQLVDFGHSGKVFFEASSVSYQAQSTVDALSNKSWDDDEDQANQVRYGLDVFDREQDATSVFRRAEDGVTS